jgi:hypothetical protein
MLRHMALVRADVSSFIRLTRIGELGTLVMANIPSSPILVTLMMEALGSSETSVLTRATQRTIPEDTLLHNKTLLAYISSQLIKKLPISGTIYLPSAAFHATDSLRFYELRLL